jgi:SAM-dependent methyltransferase
MSPNNPGLRDTLRDLVKRYPSDMISHQAGDIPRIRFNIRIALDAIEGQSHDGIEILDLGGGIGLFSIGCAAYGMGKVVLVDDFDDPVNHKVGPSILDIHKSLGVQVVSRDIIKEGIKSLPGTFDIITTFDSMEHWHASPKRLFHEVIEKLKPGGAFVLGVPNCVNMRKRITVPFGRGKWSQMEDWYEEENFRGHVREPDVQDLLYIAKDMGLISCKIYGRNWQGYYSASPLIRLVTKFADYPLRLIPSLCADIYLVGKKA